MNTDRDPVHVKLDRVGMMASDPEEEDDNASFTECSHQWVVSDRWVDDAGRTKVRVWCPDCGVSKTSSYL